MMLGGAPPLQLLEALLPSLLSGPRASPRAVLCSLHEPARPIQNQIPSLDVWARRRHHRITLRLRAPATSSPRSPRDLPRPRLGPNRDVASNSQHYSPTGVFVWVSRAPVSSIHFSDPGGASYCSLACMEPQPPQVSRDPQIA